MNQSGQLTDEELMINYQNGSYQAFEILYSRHQNKVYSFLRKRLNNEDSCAEVFQNIFLKLHKSKHLYNPKYLFLKWLYTISRSVMLDYLKKPRRETVEFKEELFLTTQKNETADIDLTGLSEREKAVIQRKYFSDEDYSEISVALKISQSNARKILSRAIAKLKIKLTKEAKP